jgi:hypothetical protein
LGVLTAVHGTGLSVGWALGDHVGLEKGAGVADKTGKGHSIEVRANSY